MDQMPRIICATGILSGAIIMLFSIIKFTRILDEVGYIQEQDRRTVTRLLHIHRSLMVMFLIGYLAVLGGVLTDLKVASDLMVAGIFFFGAVFVFIGIYIQSRMIIGVRARAEAEIARCEAEERANSALVASEAKSAFLANMSHEIRTPMNGLMGMIELTLETELSVEQREYLDMVRASADSLLALINDILDFSKVEVGMLKIEKIEFSLRDTVGAVMRSLALRAHQKGLELAYSIPDDIPDDLIGDSARIRQVMINLTGNAIKFTEFGEVFVFASRVSGTDDSVLIQFTIRDTGIGIPADRLGTVFESFTQVDASTTRKYGGSGLGLAIASRLAELMGGRIWVESEFGRGSSFHFTVPAGVQKNLLKPRSVAYSGMLEGIKTIIVDDNLTNRRILEQNAINWKMKPVTVESGTKALAMMEMAVNAGVPFQLGIIDCQMPVMDGFMLAEKIKNNKALSSIRLIMLSSADNLVDAKKCRDMGFDSCLHKPVSQSNLLEAVISVIAGTRHHAGSVVDKACSCQPTPVHPARVLLVEDNSVNQFLGTKLLEKAGYAVEVAENGLVALRFLRDRQFDLVLMDIQMPEMDGFAATRTIRAEETATGKHIPIIAMTAHALKGDRDKCLAAGMDDYVSKPLDPRLLFSAIEIQLNLTTGQGHEHSPVDQEADSMYRQLLEKFGGNAGTVATMASLFIRDSEAMLQAIKNAVEIGDPIAIERAAHSLKGAAGNFETGSAFELAASLESAGRAGDMTGISLNFESLTHEISVLNHKLGSIIKGV